MASKSAADLVAVLKKYRLLPPAQLVEAETMAEQCPDARALAQELRRRDWLTTYQISQIGQGKAKELLFGPSYVLLSQLGEGGMGKVFKARHQRLGRVVALKFIKPELVDRPEAQARFKREATAAAQLTHPNVVILYDADEVDGIHFCSMEFIDGTDLAHMLKEQGRLPMPLACDYVRQAALGLQHAHEHGLVHRDIKPANLMVTRQGVIKILDMGLARGEPVTTHSDTATSVTGEGVVVGTVDYMAPEQAKNSKTVDARADLYSLGCTLYHLLAGQPPFAEGLGWERLLKHQMDEPTPLEQLRPEVPAELARLLRQLLAKRPEERPQSAAEVVTALAPFCQGLGTENRPFILTTEESSLSTTREANQAPTVALTPSQVKWSRTLSLAQAWFGQRSKKQKLLVVLGAVFFFCAGGLCLLPKPEDQPPTPVPPPSLTWPKPPLGLTALSYLPPRSTAYAVVRPGLVPQNNRPTVQPLFDLLHQLGMLEFSPRTGLDPKEVDHEAFALDSALEQVQLGKPAGVSHGTLAIQFTHPLNQARQQQLLQAIGAEPQTQLLQPHGLPFHLIKAQARKGLPQAPTVVYLPTDQQLVLSNLNQEQQVSLPGLLGSPSPYPSVFEPLFARMEGAFFMVFLTLEGRNRKLMEDLKLEPPFFPPKQKEPAQQMLKRAKAVGLWVKWDPKHVEINLGLHCENDMDAAQLAAIMAKGWKVSNWLLNLTKYAQVPENQRPALKEWFESLRFMADQGTLTISGRLSVPTVEKLLRP